MNKTPRTDAILAQIAALEPDQCELTPAIAHARQLERELTAETKSRLAGDRKIIELKGIIEAAAKQLEASETPFYEGMKKLRAALKKTCEQVEGIGHFTAAQV